ncbi:hypothetical protein [Mesorhizobium amorphae]|nr:hypothetical protein [Mesorhizobium amorphae]
MIIGDGQMPADEQARPLAQRCFSAETVMLLAVVDRELTHD